MTYASDLGLKVGSKIKTLEKSAHFDINEVITLVVDDDSEAPYFTSDREWHKYPFDLGRKWEHYKENVKDTKDRLQRDKEYNVKLTGEEIFDLYLVSGYLKGRWEIYNKFQSMLGESIDPHTSMDVKVDTIDLDSSLGYSKAVAKAFKVPETEDQRKLRELKEKHAELGKAIEAMEKK